MNDPIPEKENTNERRLRFVKEHAAKWMEPFRSAGLWIKDDTFIPKDTLRYWADPVGWDNRSGKITLSGDSAHPMTPRKLTTQQFDYTTTIFNRFANMLIDRGQGLNIAIEDASKLVAAIKRSVQEGGDLGKEIMAYDTEMLARGSAEIKLSLMQTLMIHDWDKFISSPLMKGMGMARQNPAPAVASRLARDD